MILNFITLNENDINNGVALILFVPCCEVLYFLRNVFSLITLRILIIIKKNRKYFLIISLVKNAIFILICHVNAVQNALSLKTIRLWLHNREPNKAPPPGKLLFPPQPGNYYISLYKSNKRNKKPLCLVRAFVYCIREWEEGEGGKKYLYGPYGKISQSKICKYV